MGLCPHHADHGPTECPRIDIKGGKINSLRNFRMHGGPLQRQAAWTRRCFPIANPPKLKKPMWLQTRFEHHLKKVSGIIPEMCTSSLNELAASVLGHRTTESARMFRYFGPHLRRVTPDGARERLQCTLDIALSIGISFIMISKTELLNGSPQFSPT